MKARRDRGVDESGGRRIRIEKSIWLYKIGTTYTIQPAQTIMRSINIATRRFGK